MRARDRDTYPTARRDSTYGCCKCGAYRNIKTGDKLYCTNCRTVAPMIDVRTDDARATTADRRRSSME